MPVRNQNWYDLQAGRRYPLDDTSTGIDDSGGLLNDSIIVDCHIRFPSYAGSLAYVQAITVTDNLVTVIIGAGSNPTSADNMSIAAISLVKPIQANRNYLLTPLTDGVAGWIVFGDGIKTNFIGRYATPIQTLINARNARSYAPLPVTSLRKTGVGAGLTGLVTIDAEAPVIVEKKTITITGKSATALVFRTDTNTNNFRANPLQYFLGPCGQRPESGTCPKTPIETINGVGPDCNGDLKITADGLNLYPFNPKGGIGVELPISLSTVCDTPTIPRQPVDDCESSSSSTSGSSSSSTSAASSSSSSTSAGANVISAQPIIKTISEDFAGTVTYQRAIVATAAAAINYQWQYSDDQIGWQNVASGTAYKPGYAGSENVSGVTTSVLTVVVNNGGIGNIDRKYRVILSSFGASNVIAYAEPLTSSSSVPAGSSSSASSTSAASSSSASAAPIVFIAQPSETTIIAGGAITFNYTVLSPTQTLSDRLWEYSDNNGATWLSAGKGSISTNDANPLDGTTILGALALTNVSAVANNRLYRVTVQAQNGASITSTPARLTVIPIASSSSSSSSAAPPAPTFNNWSMIKQFTPGFGEFVSLAYGNNKWIAVGAFSPNAQYINTSPVDIYGAAYSDDNGITWNGVSIPASIKITPKSVAFGAGRFVMVGLPDAPSTQQTTASKHKDILTSTDGFAWTERSSNTVYKVTSGLNPGLNNVTYSGGKFIATGHAGQIAISSDGINWVDQSIDSRYSISKITYGNNTYFATGTIRTTTTEYGATSYSYAPMCFISKNAGAGWRTTAIPYSKDPCARRDFTEFSAPMFGNGLFVMFRKDAYYFYSPTPGQPSCPEPRNPTQVVCTSTDGVTWTDHALPGRLGFIADDQYYNQFGYRIADEGDGFQTLLFANGVFYALNGYVINSDKTDFVTDPFVPGQPWSPPKAAMSVDGRNWTEVNAARNPWKAMAYGNNKVMAVGFDIDLVFPAKEPGRVIIYNT